MQGNSRRIVIIGGGISGLAAAHRLVEHSRSSGQQFELLLLEANSRLGGIVQTERRDGFLLERGPDSFISEKPEALALARRVGLESHLIETNKERRRSLIVRRGRLLPVPEGFQLLAPSRVWPFITSDIFSWAAKARIAMDLLLPGGRENGDRDESIASFVRRRFGREALERMAQPMVGGIYTGDPEKLSLRSTFPRFLEMERKQRSVIRALRKESSNPTLAPGGHPTESRDNSSGSQVAKPGRGGTVSEGSGASGARYSLFLSFDRGMQMLVDQLAARLQPASVRLGSQVKQLVFDRSSRQWNVDLRSHKPMTAAAVCIALPAYTAASLLKETDGRLSTELEAIPYESTATVNLAYQRADIPHPLDGFGFVVPFVEKRSLLACTFSSVKFAGRAPEGQVLLRAFVGGALQPELFALDEDEMIRRVRSDLRDLLGIEAQPLFAEVTKWQRSMPQYNVGHLDRVRRISELVSALPNLTLAGNAYSGVGIPDCIRSGEAAADGILKL